MSAGKILVMDDDEYILNFVSFVLTERKYQVLFAKDGMEALKLVSKEKPDLLLMDLMVPKLNAYQITDELRGDPETRHIPVVLMTASSKEDLEENSRKHGITRILRKPFSAQDLVQQIQLEIGMPDVDA